MPKYTKNNGNGSSHHDNNNSNSSHDNIGVEIEPVGFERQAPSGRHAPADTAADEDVPPDRAPTGRFVSPDRTDPGVVRRPDGRFVDHEPSNGNGNGNGTEGVFGRLRDIGSRAADAVHDADFDSAAADGPSEWASGRDLFETSYDFGARGRDTEWGWPNDER